MGEHFADFVPSLAFLHGSTSYKLKQCWNFVIIEGVNTYFMVHKLDENEDYVLTPAGN